MAKEEYYEYAVLYRDKEETKQVVEPTVTLAVDAAHAERIAMRKVSAEYDDKLDKLEIKVKRSF